MMSEGAQWYFHVLQFKYVFTEVRLIRYFDYVIQTPAVIVIKLFGNIATDWANWLAIWLLSFGWTMYLLISLGISAFILRKYNRPDLLAFQLIGILSCYMQAAPYAVALAMPAMYCFWPLFYFLLFTDGRKFTAYIWFSAMGIVLAICYEATFLFFGLFAFLSLLDLFLVKARSRNFNYFVILFSVVTAAILLNSVTKVSNQITGPFWTSLLTSLDRHRLFGLCIALVTLPIPFFIKLPPKVRIGFGLLVGFLFVSAVGYFGYCTYLHVLNSEYKSLPFQPFALHLAYSARATALPVMAVVALTCFIFKNLIEERAWLSTRVGRGLLFVLFVFTSMISLIDILLTNEWRRDIAKFDAYLESIAGCTNMSSKEFQDKNWSPSVENYGIPYSSIVRQILKNKLPISKLVFTSTPLNGQKESERNPCLEENGLFQSNQGFYVNFRDGWLPTVFFKGK
jgi:hypothetical protein